MSHTRAAALAVGLACLVSVVAGCRSGGADPSSSPSPTYQCTAPGSCTPQQAAKEQQTAKDHAAAEKALRASQAEANRLFRAGGADKPTPELKRVAADPDLASMMKVLKDFKKQGRVAHGNIAIEVVEFKTPYPEDRQEIWVCENGTTWYTTDKDGENATGHGIYQTYTVTMTRIEGLWKRTSTDKAMEVNACDG